jgi:macrodomain Ter protein organizer (MatP/YcbG family)
VSNETDMSKTKVVGTAQVWDPNSTDKTITIKSTTWKRLQKYGNHFGSTYDSIITQILDEKEGKSIPEEERSF